MRTITLLMRIVPSRRLGRVLVSTTVAAACVMAVSAPAGANAAGTPYRIDLTEGIDRSAHTITTHAGTVIAGIDFVEPKDVAASQRQPTPSGGTLHAAAALQWHCELEWYFIHAGGSNTYWKPAAVDGISLVATGNRNADYWNQEFLPCWLDNWGAGAFAFLSNATGKFVQVHSSASWTQLIADWPPSNTTPQARTATRMVICTFDGFWDDIATQPDVDSSLKVYRNSDGYLYSATASPLNGNNLFRIDPVEGAVTC
jgi:hypothetical protein